MENDLRISDEKTSSSLSRTLFSSFYKNLKERIMKLKKVAQDDPRRISHSLKVGFSLTITSVFYYFNPLFDEIGSSAMWAVLTVVVVMEYTVGATLCKGLNRSFATLFAGALALGAHRVSDFASDKGESFVLGGFIFILASIVTFFRFVPELKKKYDYGLMIFILTFSLTAASSYLTDEIVLLAQQRLSTICIGVAVCFCTTVFFPVWAGEDLHKMVAVDLENLATFLEGLSPSYSIDNNESAKQKDGHFEDCYRRVLNSKAAQEALVNFAIWEPRHGHFRFRHPWNQYLKIGEASRRCAYFMDALIVNLDKSLMDTTKETEHVRKTRKTWFSISSESSKAVTMLALGIRTFTFPSAVSQHLAAGMVATEELSKILFEEELVVTPVVLHIATVSSLLTQMVDCVQQLTVAVEELAHLAHFTACPAGPANNSNSMISKESSHVVLVVNESFSE